MESIEEELAATRMFRNLSPEQIKAIAELGEEVEFADGRALMIEGDASGRVLPDPRRLCRPARSQAPTGNNHDRNVAQRRPRGLVVAVRAVPHAFRCPLAGDDPGDQIRRRGAAPSLRGGRSAGLRAYAQLHVGDRRASARDPASATRRVWQRHRQLSRCARRGRDDAAPPPGGQPASRDSRHVDGRARAAARAGAATVRPRSVRHAVRLRRRRDPDLGQRRGHASRPPALHDTRGGRGERRAMRGRAGRYGRTARAVRQHLAAGARRSPATC